MPLSAEMAVAAAFTVVTAVSWRLYVRRACDAPADEAYVAADMTPASFAALAFLFGFSYGFMRIVSFGGFEESVVTGGMLAESAGTCLAALLLAAVFFLQDRWSLFEMCLFISVPLVATGMLLVSLAGEGSLAPAIINTGGFACFFDLTWYFAAVTSASGRGRVAPLVAMPFCVNQLGQVVGSAVPRAYSNAVSDALVYLLLLLAVGILYWQAKVRSRHPGAHEGPAALGGGRDAATWRRSSPPPTTCPHRPRWSGGRGAWA